jgi:hypothetical protein
METKGELKKMHLGQLKDKHLGKVGTESRDLLNQMADLLYLKK